MSTSDDLIGPEPLRRDHSLAGFSCGAPGLDSYLTTQAFPDQRAEKSRTYVVVRRGKVVGYYSLAAAGVERALATERLAAGQGAHSIPVILLARLAVNGASQGQGIGEMLVVDALVRAAGAADVIGARAVIVHAISPTAASFYARYGFEASPTDPLHLIMLMKDVRASIGKGA